MIKALIGTCGIIIFVFCLITGINLVRNESSALALDDKKTRFGMISDDAPPFCTWEVELPERVMSEDKSQAVVMHTKNAAKKDCESYISLRAPGFDISPAKEEQKITLPAQGKGSISWIITPRKSGAYEIAVSDALNTKILGVTVTNIFGLDAIQAKLFSTVGGIFGPMMTIPWWWDRWRRKPKQDIRKDEGGGKEA